MKNVLVSSVAAMLVVACGGSEPSGEVEPDIQVGSDAGSDLPADVPPIEGGCDPSRLPAQSPCVLHESVGVFVSAAGNDANDGSRARPYGTLKKGIEAAKAAGRRVYVCAGTYREATITLLEGVAVFGNLTCQAPGWAVGTEHAILATTMNPAARAKGIVAETRIEGLDLIAPAGAASGESSIGLIAENAGGLHFVNARIVASAAAAGTDGFEAAQMPPTPASFNGGAFVAPSGCTYDGVPGYYTCSGSKRAAGGVGICVAGDLQLPTNPGGEGGRSGMYRYDNPFIVRAQRPPGFCGVLATCYSTNESGFPAVATAATNTGAIATYAEASLPVAPTSYTSALPGGAGAAGTDGANGGLGALSPEGYVPGDGTQGGHGGAGQGGGGGGGIAPTSTIGTYFSGASGSGGGAGGCPGLAGGAGTGGGASIGLLAIGSALRLDTTSVESAAGGRGGKGSVGSIARPGGAGGSSPAPGLSQGAAGGAGGRAGVSGHGSSGPSFAIAWSGAQPLLAPDSTTMVAPAQSGQPELLGEGSAVPATPPGSSEPIHAF